MSGITFTICIVFATVAIDVLRVVYTQPTAIDLLDHAFGNSTLPPNIRYVIQTKLVNYPAVVDLTMALLMVTLIKMAGWLCTIIITVVFYAFVI
jgi:hypothetical protein